MARRSEVTMNGKRLALGADQTVKDGTLADNSILDGALGDRLRVKYSTTGTYGDSSSIKIDAIAKG